MPNMEDVNWDERYKGEPENRPWDSGEPDPELVEQFPRLGIKSGSALEIGCGTGTNAIWLANHGMKVLATDISPTAIDAARKKASEEGAKSTEFVIHDICESSPLPPASADFVFDRGVFHVMSKEQRPAFIKNVAEAMKPGAYWYCLAGSADESKPADRGPPRLTAAELLGGIEEKFEVMSLQRSKFTLPDGSEYLAWKALFRRR